MEAIADLPARRRCACASPASKGARRRFLCGTIGMLFDRLGLPFVREGQVFVVTPPSYRFDIEIEEDLIEEIARLHGYDNIPAPAPQKARQCCRKLNQTRDRSRVRLRQIVADAGYQEVVNYAFVEEAWEADFSGNAAPIRLTNPIASQMSVMRSTLFGGLVCQLSTNPQAQAGRVRVFETGRCFERSTSGAPVTGFDQPWRLAALAYGTALPEQWAASRNVDFFDVKGMSRSCWRRALPVRKKAAHPALHPGRSAQC